MSAQTTFAKNVSSVPFVKMHGLGNDFIIINLDIISHIDTDFVKKISDRRLGIGCDQFITYKLINDSNCEMGIYNQDGSVAKACGNASRCLARLIYDQHGISKLTLKVSDRLVHCEYLDPDNISVDMGPPKFDEKWMPPLPELWEFAQRYAIEPKELLCVDVANPHLVIFTELGLKDQSIIGQTLQNTSLFLGGVNVNFATIKDDHIHLKVWERGTGFTYACGSGAIASFAAANKLGFANNSATVKFELGELRMLKTADNIFMQGPASYVFVGEYFKEE